ncbi:MAG: putative N-acetylmannosamine-6-phosphate 2-epimerase [Pyrinomonadaceae bacterium]
MFESLKGKLLVSCQASEGDAFRDSESMARFALSAVQGGAAGIRAEGAEDVRRIRAAVDVPIIGIKKSIAADGRILITPSTEAARELVAAGADMIALDCTARGQSYEALDRLRQIKHELNVPALADIATLEEARAAEMAGADFVLSTMRGYTDDTAHIKAFDAECIAELCGTLKIPVIAEGRIWTIEEARDAITAGAYAVIIGSAITRPDEISRRFVSGVESAASSNLSDNYVIAVDIGGTNIKSGIVSGKGKLVSQAVDPTPAQNGREAILREAKRIVEARFVEARERAIAPTAIGIATAGWVDAASGTVIYASGNLPGWTGTRVGDELREAFAMPVTVENDANAMAVAEHHFGAARGVDDFVCITLGTGVGCGVYLDGKLRRGSNSMASNLSHMQIERDGLKCNCGKRGCFETYVGTAAIMRYANNSFATAAEIIKAANDDYINAREAIAELARRLADGCAILVELFDPSLLLLGGGLTQNNPLLLSELRESLQKNLLAPDIRNLCVELSTQSYFGGVIGAAAIALEKVSA